jgi:hypothetical protein
MLRKKPDLIWLAVLLIGANPLPRAEAQAAEHSRVYYAAPEAGPDGDGSVDKPLTLAAALSARSPARPGDAIILRGGVYRGAFESGLAGAEDRPVLVRPFRGERATIDGSLTVRGAWTIYRGFEVTNSAEDRSRERPAGLNIFGRHTKFINLVVHDAGNGMAFWSAASDSEIYGCIIYRNGWQAPDPARGSGHGIYAQNETGVKRIIDNIICNQFGWGIHAYAQEGSLKGFDIEGNVVFNNGSATRQGYRYDNILIGGYRPAERISVISNYTYHTPGKGGRNRLGYTASNKDAVVKDNYFAGGSPALALLGWEKLILAGNTFAGLQNLIAVSGPKAAAEGNYDVDNNTYLGGDPAGAFQFQNQSLDFAGWQRATGYDKHSRWAPLPARGQQANRIFMRPNRYEPGRVHLIIYNWERRDTVEVDVKDALKAGARYELRDVLDYFGGPAAAGVYGGEPLKMPMAGAEFGVFVLTSGP